ncbi:MAG TPA: UrcA family protein [Steroidobacteraceae bacterium]|nr:UrcA family protein [Steroidobacteraceae bacterium]
MTSQTLTIGGRLRAATTLTAVAACLAIGTLGSARAAEPSMRVAYQDLNLSTEQGSQALYARIAAAARAVCAPEDIRDLQARAAVNSCREQAIAHAVQSVDSPRLAALYAAHLQRS